jgi:dipeptidyl aminopeptidase/acylaminoacyl peptidase
MYEIDVANVSLFACVVPPPDGISVRGIVVDFHGLGGGMEMGDSMTTGVFFAEDGALYVYPYYGPWSWMNDVAVRYCDSVVSAVIERFRLSPDVPVVATGGSMGGLSALVFARYSRLRVVACAANCPVCDLPHHYTERPDLPRTLHVAFGHYACPFQDALKSASPLHLAVSMPRIPYYIVHGDADVAVNKERHSDRLVAELLRLGYDITYDEVPGMPHCALPPRNEAAFRAFILNHMG